MVKKSLEFDPLFDNIYLTLKKLLMKKLLIWAFLFTGFIMTTSCASDDFEEEGICIRCVTEASATTEAVDSTACSNGDGTITVTMIDGTTETREDDTGTFRISQEASGATCM